MIYVLYGVGLGMESWWWWRVMINVLIGIVGMLDHSHRTHGGSDYYSRHLLRMILGRVHLHLLSMPVSWRVLHRQQLLRVRVDRHRKWLG